MSPSTTRGSGARATPTPKTCRDCDQPTWSPKSPYCDFHRSEHLKAKWRNTPPMATCEVCGVEFQPYKSGQKRCTDPGCRKIAKRANDARQEGRDDPQMERLFKSYENRQDIHIDDRDDGTRVMIVSDYQIPFVDEAFLKAQMAFAADFRPHDLIYDGDTLDFYGESDFDKNPMRRFSIADEIAQGEAVLYDFSKRIAVGGNQWWIDGNHEDRLRRYIWRHAGDIAEIVPDLDSLLHLDKYCAGSVPYGKAVDYLGFTVTHGNYVSAHSGYTAKRHADRYQSSGCNGHTHRCGSHSWRDGRGRSHTWYEIGCGCRLDLEYVRGVANWQHGFLCGVVMNGALHPQLIRVIETDAGRGFYAFGDYYPIE